MNIIGVAKDKNADDGDTNGNGHRIFVKLEGNTRILLTEGDFAVLDYDGTDGVAKFQLPNPDEDDDGITTYSVYVRGLGKLNGSATIKPGIVDENGDEYYSAETVTVMRTKNSKFVNVSRELLYVYVDLTDDDVDNPVRYPLFSEELWEYFWDYDNNGLKLCQLRFYEVPTNVN